MSYSSAICVSDAKLQKRMLLERNSRMTASPDNLTGKRARLPQVNTIIKVDIMKGAKTSREKRFFIVRVMSVQIFDDAYLL